MRVAVAVTVAVIAMTAYAFSLPTPVPAAHLPDRLPGEEDDFEVRLASQAAFLPC